MEDQWIDSDADMEMEWEDLLEADLTEGEIEDIEALAEFGY